MFKDFKDTIIEDQLKTINRLNDRLDTEQELKWKLIKSIVDKDEYIAKLQKELKQNDL